MRDAGLVAMSTHQERSEERPLLGGSHPDVYPVFQSIRNDVARCIDTPLTHDAMLNTDLTYTVVIPLRDKYHLMQSEGNRSIVFCFLVTRVYFIRDKSLATVAVSRTRAELCEILAIELIRAYGNDFLNLTAALTTSWKIFAGADPAVLRLAEEEWEDLEERIGSAIEIAILGKAKRFIKSNSCQKVIDMIWTGKVVYQAQSSHSILSDTYKQNPIHFYDPHKAPLLDHYRLKVPSIRSVLEYTNFLGLFILFVVAIEFNEPDRLNVAELCFMIYALGFSLEKVAAMQEHGIRVYFKGTWNGFDLAFVTTYIIYASFRIYGVYHGGIWARQTGVEFLALIACLMFPRLAFVTLKNNLMVLSIRAMIVQFLVLMMIAAFCFGGFLYALWTLSRYHRPSFGAGTIAWWMLDLWFGLDASGFDRSTDFHRFFGPVLMVSYACLSNTLLLTILVSILSNTFAKINEDAAAEAMFRRAVLTIEGVKADSLFSYQPPINLVALCIMLPASWLLTPRWFHKVNVFVIRTTNFPVLLLIALYERQSKHSGTTGFKETLFAAAEKLVDTFPRNIKRLALFEHLTGVNGDIDAIFEIQDELDENDNSALDISPDPENNVPTSTASPPPPSPRDIPRKSKYSFPASGDRPRRPSNIQGSPRPRMNSILSRGVEAAEQAAQNFTSPLLNLYQPLTLGGSSIPEDSSVPQNGSGRRRMSAINMRRGTESRSFPKMGAHLSESPSSGPPLPTSGQVQEEETESVGGSVVMEKRLGAIEARQERIEELLERIAGKLKI